MSHTESWPGEPSDVSEVEDELEEPADDDEDTGDDARPLDDPELDDEPGADDRADDEPSLRLAGSSGGQLDVPDDVDLLEGEARGARRGVGIVVSRSNAEITNRL